MENNLVNLECCTNSDANPQPRFEWSRMAKKQAKSRSHSRPFDNDTQKTNSEIVYLSGGKICNVLQLNLSRYDNNHFYKCSVSNEALINKKSLDDNLFVIVECKLKLRGFFEVKQKFILIFFFSMLKISQKLYFILKTSLAYKIS